MTRKYGSKRKKSLQETVGAVPSKRGAKHTAQRILRTAAGNRAAQDSLDEPAGAAPPPGLQAKEAALPSKHGANLLGVSSGTRVQRYVTVDDKAVKAEHIESLRKELSLTEAQVLILNYWISAAEERKFKGSSELGKKLELAESSTDKSVLKIMALLKDSDASVIRQWIDAIYVLPEKIEERTKKLSTEKIEEGLIIKAKTIEPKDMEKLSVAIQIIKTKVCSSAKELSEHSVFGSYGEVALKYSGIVEDTKNSEAILSIASDMQEAKKFFPPEHWQKLFKSGSKEEVRNRLAAILAYSAGSYVGLNNFLREPPKKPKTLKETAEIAGYKAMVEHATAGLESLPKYVDTVYRYTNLEVEKIDSTYKEKTKVTEAAFTSASKSGKGFEDSILFVIKSKNGRDVASVAKDPGEEEVLFAPGSQFFVDSVVKSEKNPLRTVKMTET